jgi:peptidoglycan/LPS O-acetylase OafA/YrhL
VLSGFLICFILKREFDKYGDIDWTNFMKMRLLRLYPALFIYLMVEIINFVHTKTPFLTILEGTWTSFLMIDNFVWNGKKIAGFHLWTIAAEI